MVALFLCPPSVHFGANFSFHQCLPGYKHITLISSGVGGSALVQGNDCIVHVLVHQMQPWVGETGIPPGGGVGTGNYHCSILEKPRVYGPEISCLHYPNYAGSPQRPQNSGGEFCDPNGSQSEKSGEDSVPHRHLEEPPRRF